MSFSLRTSLAALVLLLASAAAGASTAAGITGAAPSEPPRPKVGLVLSGGGARGLAHVGVLKVLHEARVPVDLVVGTSMGSIIGGLYASGMSPGELERELRALRWDDLFSSRVDRPELPARRKELDFEFSAGLEVGFRDGELRLPQSVVSSRGLESMLRRYTVPVRGVNRFDELPVPFRAVATDMVSGEAVELSEGDLALALRSSMSVPGVFAPTERAGRLLGDGGLVNNLPVDVARRMGAEVVIAVNVGTPLAGRESLGSVVGLTAQMINILTEQNVQRSLASLKAADVLVKPALDRLSSADFSKTAELIALGEEAARAVLPQLSALASPTPAVWGERRRATPAPPPVLAFVDFEGSAVTSPQRLAPRLESKPGQAFDPARAERDARRLAASGDYVRADYHLTRTAQGEGLVFELQDKPWGPHYLRLGLDLSTDFASRSSLDVKIAHERRWLTPAGTEWRNRLTVGENPLLGTEIVHPLQWADTLDNDWFFAGAVQAERRSVRLFTSAGDEQAVFDRLAGRIVLDLGRPWAAYGEMRIGVLQNFQRTSPRLLGAGYTGATAPSTSVETGLRLRVVLDQLDYALFPLAGYRVEAEGAVGQRRGSFEEPFHRVQIGLDMVRSFGRHTLNSHLRASLSDEGGSPLVGRFTLGGFHNLSGYAQGQLNGNHLLLGRLAWYMRLNQDVALTRGFFMGASLEAGNVWSRRGDVSLGDLRWGSSVFLGADTGVGPMYLGITSAPGGSTGLVFLIGRP